MSLFTNQDEVEKICGKVFASSKEKAINDLLTKFDKYKNEVKSLQFDWANYLLKKNDYINNNPLFFFKLFAKLMEFGIYQFSNDVDLLFNKLYSLPNEFQPKLICLNYLIISYLEVSKYPRNCIHNIFEVIIFNNIISNEYESFPYEVLSNLFQKFSIINPFKIDFVIETLLVIAFMFLVDYKDTSAAENILHISKKRVQERVQQNLRYFPVMFHHYLHFYKGTVSFEAIKFTIVFFLLSDQQSHLDEYYNKYPEQFIRIIFSILKTNKDDTGTTLLNDYINFEKLECKCSNFFDFSMDDKIYDSTYKTTMENYSKRFNIYMMKRKERIKNKLSQEELIVNTIKYLKHIFIDSATSLSLSSKFMKTPLTIYLTTFDKLIFTKKTFLKEIALFIKKMIKHYGRLLYEEWEIIFDIIKKILENHKKFQDNEIIKILEKILSYMYKLYNNQLFNGNFEQLKQTLVNFPILSDNNLNLLKIQYSLGTKDNFISNIDKIIKEFFISGSDNHYVIYMKNYLLEIIRYNYVYSLEADDESDITNKIEEMLSSNFFLLFDIKAENLVYFSYTLCEFLFRTKNITFFKDIILKLFTLNFEYNKDESYQMYHILIVETMRTIITRLNNHFQKEKLNYILKFIFNKKKMETYVFFRTALKLATHIIINKNLFVHLVHQKSYSNTYMKFPCCLIFDYNHKEIKQQKNKYKTKEEYISFKQNYYAPFIAFNLEKIFNFFINEFKNTNEFIFKNDHVFYEILEFYNNCLLNVFTLKTPRTINFFSFISKLFDKKEKIITIASQNIQIKEKLLEIFLNCINIQNPQKQNENSFVIASKCINFVFLLWNKDKIVFKEKFKKINLTEFFTHSKNKGDDLTKTNDIYILFRHVYQYIHIFTIYLSSLGNYNSIIPQEITEMLTDKLISEFILELLPCTFLKQKFALDIIYMLYHGKDFLVNVSSSICVKIIIIIYMLLFQTEERAIADIYDQNYSNQNFINKKMEFFDAAYLKQVKQHRHKFNLKKRIIEFIGQVTSLYYIRHIDNPGPFLNVIKDIFKETRVKTPKMEIYLELCRWNLYTGNFRDNYIPLIKEMSNEEKTHAQIYFGAKNNIIILNPIDNKSCCLSIRNPVYNLSLVIENFDDKDNKTETHGYTSKINYDDFNFRPRQHFLIEHQSNTKQRKIKRSKTQMNDNQPIHKYNLPIYKGMIYTVFEMKINALDNFELNEPININTNTYPNPIQNANILFHQIATLSSQPTKTFSYLNFKFPNYNLRCLDEIAALDSMTIHFELFCGIAFVPNSYNIKENDIYSYNGEVTKEYIAFINKIGELYNVTKVENSNMNLGNHLTNQDCTYIIKSYDEYFSIIFHVSNLIHNIKKRKDIIKNDKVCLLFVEKYYFDYSKFLNDNTNAMIYIMIFPVSSTNVIVNIVGNNRAKDLELINRIEKLYPKKFALDMTNCNSFNILKRIIIGISLTVKGYGNSLDKEAVKKGSVVYDDRKDNINFGFKEISGCDSRLKLIGDIMTKYRKFSH